MATVTAVITFHQRLTESVAEYELQKQRVMEKYPEIAKSLDMSTGDVVQKITK